MHKYLLSLLLAIIAQFSFGQETSSVYKPLDYKEVTQSGFNDAEVFQIIFYSYLKKDGKFPHASVGFLCVQKCFGNDSFQVSGFYPTENANSLVQWLYKSFPGTIENDSEIKPDYGVAFNISRQAFLEAIKVLNKNKASKNLVYQLAFNNCVSFMDEVATAIGLDTPTAIFTEPNGYVKTLYDLNKN